jgi:predicted transcriptional regulator
MSTALRSYILEEVRNLYQAQEKDFNEATDRILARLFDPNSIPTKAPDRKSTKRKSYESLGDLAPIHLLILNTIQTHGPMSRQELATKTGLKVSSVCGRVKELLDNCFLCVDGTTTDPDTNREVEVVNVVRT